MDVSCAEIIGTAGEFLCFDVAGVGTEQGKREGYLVLYLFIALACALFMYPV